MRLSYVAMFVIIPAVAQESRVTFGVIGGVPVETPLGRAGNQIPFVLGPSVNFRLFSHVSLASGVLFHRMGEGIANGTFFYPENAITFTFSKWSGNAIEIPLLLKYEFLRNDRTWRPFVTAGPSIRRSSVQSSYSASAYSGSPLGSTIVGQPQLLTRDEVKWNLDPNVGLGVDVKAGRFHLEPEVRYSYWGAGTELPVRKNQVDFLLGFRF